MMTPSHRSWRNVVQRRPGALAMLIMKTSMAPGAIAQRPERLTDLAAPHVPGRRVRGASRGGTGCPRSERRAPGAERRGHGQLPLGRFRIVEWQARERYLIAHNDPADPADAGLWTRIDRMPLEGMPPYAWGFCMTAYAAATAEAARATPAANRAAPTSGCNGHPFSRLKPLP